MPEDFDAPPASPPVGPPVGFDADRYWRTNLRYLAVLLSIWFIVSYGCGIVLVDWLNRYRLGGAKLGFWFAQQGSIYVFVVLIAVYVWLMNRLDRRYGVREV